MSALDHWHPGDRAIELFLGVSLGVMTRATRRFACVIMCMCLVGCVIASSTRFGAARSAPAVAATAASVHPSSCEREASPAAVDVAAQDAAPKQEPAKIPDSDDPKLAGRFTGRVIGRDGKPVFGARVFIVPNDPKIKVIGPVRAHSDADGRFAFDAPDMTFTELDGLPARRQGLLVAALEGYAPDWAVTWGAIHDLFGEHWGPIKGEDLTLRLAKNDVTIHGRFLDPEGRPFAGARVRLIELMVPAKHDLDAHLVRESKIINRMNINFERDLHQPHVLPGVTVEAQTDATGRFTMSGLGRDRLAVLSVSGPNVVDTTLTVMTRLARDVDARRDAQGKPTQMIHGAGFILQMKRGRTVTGVVRDVDSHQPIPGMWVGPGGNAVRGLIDGDYPWTTDENGRFTITGLDPSLTSQEITAFPQPGRPYLLATAVADIRSEAVIECKRGIPFRLRLIDEEGRPFEAEVSYHDVQPNPHVTSLQNYDARWPINRAARRSDGTYQGFVLPGPGAVLVKTPRGFNYRPAHVDPKAFFAPGKTDWTKQEQISTYGNHDTLMRYPGWWIDQHDFAAIVLVNPPVDSLPLDLSATVVRDKPRRVSLIDPEGKPVVGVETEGMTWFPWDTEPRLRAGAFSITNLNPDWGRRITFVKEDRKLTGFLMARGDSEAPYTVRMQHWGTVTGRLLDENGKALPLKDAALPGRIPASLYMGNWRGTVTESDRSVGEHPGAQTDLEGRFRVERLVPGLRYTAEVYLERGGLAGLAFENLVVQPGEVRDLGDIRTKPPVDVRGK